MMSDACAVPTATPSAPAPRAESDAKRATFFFLIRTLLLNINGWKPTSDFATH
jgi:hypothetical protein